MQYSLFPRKIIEDLLKESKEFLKIIPKLEDIGSIKYELITTFEIIIREAQRAIKHDKIITILNTKFNRHYIMFMDIEYTRSIFNTLNHLNTSSGTSRDYILHQINRKVNMLYGYTKYPYYSIHYVINPPRFEIYSLSWNREKL